MQRLHSLDTLWVENFDEIALSRMVKEIEANLCFAIFAKNSKIQNGRHFGGGENFLKIAKITFLRYPVGRKFRRNRSISHGLGDMSTFAFFSIQNSYLLIYLINSKIALSRTVKEMEANLCFAIFGKNSKIQNGRHFWGGEIFLKIAKITFLRYPVGRKFRRNRSISHGLGDMSTFAFFSIQNSYLLIYLINYSLIYEAIPPKSNPIQAINPMNLHTKFQKARLNSIP